MTTKISFALWNFHAFCRKSHSHQQGVLSPFDDRTGFYYHDNRLRDFLIASSLNGRRLLFFDQRNLVWN